MYKIHLEQVKSSYSNVACKGKSVLWSKKSLFFSNIFPLLQEFCLEMCLVLRLKSLDLDLLTGFGSV